MSMGLAISLAVAVASLGLAACETTGNNVAGTADYDALSRAHADCVAQGGELVLKDEGDPQYIQDYVCKRK